MQKVGHLFITPNNGLETAVAHNKSLALLAPTNQRFGDCLRVTKSTPSVTPAGQSLHCFAHLRLSHSNDRRMPQEGGQRLLQSDILLRVEAPLPHDGTQAQGEQQLIRRQVGHLHWFGMTRHGEKNKNERKTPTIRYPAT